MRKAKKALDGALETISKKDKEIEEVKANVRRVVQLSGKSWYSLVAEREAALALVKWSDNRYVEFKQKEHPCKKHNHHPKDGPCIQGSQIPSGG